MPDRKLYIRRMKAKLDIRKAEFDKLRAQARYVNADVRLKVQKDIEFLERRVREIRKRLAEISEGTGEAWDKIRKGADTSWDTLKTGIREVQSRFRK